MRRVLLAAPSGDRFDAYRRACRLHACRRGEAGIDAAPLPECPDLEAHIANEQGAFAWLPQSHVLALYVDHGFSPRMRDLVVAAEAIAIPVEYRTIHADAWAHVPHRTIKPEPSP